MSSYHYSFYSPTDYTADTFFNNGFIGLNGFLLLGNFNNGFNGLNGFLLLGNFNNGFNGYYFQGVHLSQVHQPRSAPTKQEDGLTGFIAATF